MRVAASIVVVKLFPVVSPTQLPPGPAARRGVLDSLGYYYRFYKNPVGFVRGRFERYGDIYYAPSRGTPLYVIRHPDHIHEVLNRRAADFGKTHSAFEQLEALLGRGLLTTDGSEWRRQRRMVNPAFTRKRLAGYALSMSDEAVNGAARWADGQVRDMSREMMDLTLRVVTRTLFGHDVSHQTHQVAEAMEAFRNALGVHNLFPKWIPMPQRSRTERGLATVNRIIFEMIERRRSGVQPRAEPPDLLQLLLDAVDEEGDGGTLSAAEIRDQLITLFVAGHETTSHALTWTLYLLSQYPGAEARLHEELDEVLAGRVPTFEDLDRLPYTAQIFDEAMRLYPPAYSLARRAERDTQIGDYAVPTGSEVVIWIYMTHHDPRWYPDPERFDPSRFAPELVVKRPKLSFLPFGRGARACVGKAFALMEGRLILATLAQRFRFELAQDQRVAMSPRVTLAPKHGMRMVLLRRA